MTCYVVFDENNRHVETFAGPHRLAKWDALPAGWGIEEFFGDVSRGIVTLEYVRRHAAEPVPAGWDHLFTQPDSEAWRWRNQISTTGAANCSHS